MKSKNSRKIIFFYRENIGNNCTYLTSPWNYDHGISVCVDDPDFF